MFKTFQSKLCDFLVSFSCFDFVIKFLTFIFFKASPETIFFVDFDALSDHEKCEGIWLSEERRENESFLGGLLKLF